MCQRSMNNHKYREAKDLEMHVRFLLKSEFLKRENVIKILAKIQWKKI